MEACVTCFCSVSGIIRLFPHGLWLILWGPLTGIPCIFIPSPSFFLPPSSFLHSSYVLQRLIDNQVIQHKLVDMATLVTAGQLFVDAMAQVRPSPSYVCCRHAHWPRSLVMLIGHDQRLHHLHHLHRLHRLHGMHDARLFFHEHAV